MDSDKLPNVSTNFNYIFVMTRFPSMKEQLVVMRPLHAWLIPGTLCSSCFLYGFMRQVCPGSQARPTAIQKTPEKKSPRNITCSRGTRWGAGLKHRGSRWGASGDSVRLRLKSHTHPYSCGGLKGDGSLPNESACVLWTWRWTLSFSFQSVVLQGLQWQAHYCRLWKRGSHCQHWVRLGLC